MMAFETLTLVPMDRRLIVADMLSTNEAAWLNAYHDTVCRTLSPHLDEVTRAWLVAATRPL